MLQEAWIRREQMLKKISLKKKVYALKRGKTAQIRATIIKMDKKKKLLSKMHGPQLSYVSSDKAIVTVTATGKSNWLSHQLLVGTVVDGLKFFFGWYEIFGSKFSWEMLMQQSIKNKVIIDDVQPVCYDSIVWCRAKDKD